MFERFTGQARRALWLAHYEAQRFDHDFIGTEHLLLGILREGSPEVLVALRTQNREPNQFIERLDTLLTDAEPAATSGTAHLTPRARETLDLAMEEARTARAPQVNVAHLFIGLIAQPDSDSRRILADLGLDLDRLRTDLRVARETDNRDLLVQSKRSDHAGGPGDPSPETLAAILLGEMPKVDFNAASVVSTEGVIPGTAELDWQLLLTQIVLALSVGMLAGFMLFDSADGMAGIASVLFVVAVFRNSWLGAIVVGTLGWFLGQKLAGRVPKNGVDIVAPLAPLVLAFLGALVGSFFGGYWRRFCPVNLKGSGEHRKPPGVA